MVTDFKPPTSWPDFNAKWTIFGEPMEPARVPLIVLRILTWEQYENHPQSHVDLVHRWINGIRLRLIEKQTRGTQHSFH